MNCFEWRRLTSDHLDGTLLPGQLRQSEEHLAACEKCRTRFERYQAIKARIGAMPRFTVPAHLKKSVSSRLASILESIQGSSGDRFSRPQGWLRASIEGVGAGVIILILIALIPRIRNWYERTVDTNMSAFSPDQFTREVVDGATAIPAPSRARPSDAPEARSDDFISESENETTEVEDESQIVRDEQDPGIKVGSSEIWRFNLKTDSPRELQPKVVQLLIDLGVPRDTPGLGGIEAPGGIQFDLAAPMKAVPGIKRLLQKLAPAQKSKAEGGESVTTETFTWYKNKSRKPIAPGKARVVIWLSQV